MDFGKKLKMLRQMANVSQNKLAKYSGVKQCQISKIEGGGDCKLQTAVKLLRGIGYKFVITMVEAEEGADYSRLELVFLTLSTLYFGGHFVCYLIR